ncbi:hypothetical protein NPIL_182581 [Nephila pilipes]|uniref:Uncharacterized protein n=1 Tax=Nephila pilipes TaxID=299642 RepID=A0A8X6QM80_NEPPI|nr:hypothetical protein NPIL_182581 [Nephila pilipes]
MYIQPPLEWGGERREGGTPHNILRSSSRKSCFTAESVRVEREETSSQVRHSSFSPRPDEVCLICTNSRVVRRVEAQRLEDALAGAGGHELWPSEWKEEYKRAAICKFIPLF